jgi:hypothetical protein
VRCCVSGTKQDPSICRPLTVDTSTLHVQAGTSMQRKVLFDRLHGYWSCLGSSQLKPEELEPARSERLLHGNVSPFAAFIAARQLHEQESQRLTVHEQFISRIRGCSLGQNQSSQKSAEVSVGGSTRVGPLAEGLEDSSKAIAPHADHCSRSDGNSLCVEMLSVLPGEFRFPSSCASSLPEFELGFAASRQQHAPRPEVLTENSVAHHTYTPQPQQSMWLTEQRNRGHASMHHQGIIHDEGAALAESQERSSHRMEDSTQVTLGAASLLSTSAATDKQTKGIVARYLPDFWTRRTAVVSAGGRSSARRSAVDDTLCQRKCAVTSIHQKLQRSKAVPRSPLLTLPPDMKLSEGWTVADEVELAVSGQEFIDRFGEASPFRLHHCDTFNFSTCSWSAKPSHF